MPLPNSLWAATAIPAPATPPLEGAARCQVCVVGGGFTGLSAALHLAERGAEVRLLEAEEPGFGASGRNGGQVIPGLKLGPDELVRRFGADLGERMTCFTGAAADLVFDLVERHGIDCRARRSGWLQAVHAEAAVPVVAARARQWQERDAPVGFLERDEAARLLGSRAYHGALLDRRGGALQPLSYARGLAAAAIAAGAVIHGASPALSLVAESGGWRIASPRGQVRAKQVILATNGYSDRLWPGLARSVVPLLSFQAATAPLGDNQRRSVLPEGQVCSDTRRLLAYFRLDDDGRLILGGRGGSRESEDPSDYREVVGLLAEIFPDLQVAGWEYFWGGKVALTRDHLPHLHEPATGVLAGLGFNGRGVAMATAMGKLLAERAAGAAAETLPLPTTPLRPIPFHGLRAPLLSALVHWKRLQDRREMAG